MRAGIGIALVSAATSLALVTSCDSGTTSGNPQPTGTDDDVPLFNPCDIPDDAIRAVGADPATKEADFFGVKIPGWEVCTWTADWYFLNVISTSHSINDVKANPRTSDIHSVQVPGREGAFTHQENVRPPGERCYATFATTAGETIEVVASKKVGETAQEDACAVALRSAGLLNGVLPK